MKVNLLKEKEKLQTFKKDEQNKSKNNQIQKSKINLKGQNNPPNKQEQTHFNESNNNSKITKEIDDPLNYNIIQERLNEKQNLYNKLSK